MRALCVVVISVVTVVAATPAEAQPTTQPGFEAPARPVRQRGQMSPEERAAALEFARVHMPHLFTFWEQLPRENQRRGRLMGFMMERYRRSLRIQRDNPEQYEAYLARLRVQDEPFEIVSRIQEAPEEEKSALREELRKRMRRLVQQWMDERNERIKELERQIQQEKQLLERDNRDIDRLANEHMNRLMGELEDRHLAPPELGMPSDQPATPASQPSDSPRRP